MALLIELQLQYRGSRETSLSKVASAGNLKSAKALVGQRLFQGRSPEQLKAENISNQVPLDIALLGSPLLQYSPRLLLQPINFHSLVPTLRQVSFWNWKKAGKRW